MMRQFRITMFLVFIIILSMLLTACSLFGSILDNQEGSVTVTFDTQGGSEIEPIIVDIGETIKLPENPIKDGYTFDGWYLDESWIIISDNTVTVSRNIILHAKWVDNGDNNDDNPTPNPQILTVSFDTHGGSEVEPITVGEGGTISLPINPTKEGFIFDGWYLDATCRIAFDETVAISGNITLYSKWIEDTPELNEYIVIFIVDDNEYQRVTVTEGNCVVIPTSPTKTCNKFMGWFLDKSGTNVFNEITLIASDITLYAKWNENHNYVVDESILPNCEKDGLTAGAHCGVCNKILIEQEIVPRTHNYGDWVDEIPSDCTNNGVRGCYECLNCHKKFDEKYNELTDLSLEIDPQTHNYGNWIEEIPANCTSMGVKGHYECSNCHKCFGRDDNELLDLSVEINASVHNYGEWIEETPSNCTNNGIMAHYECLDCNKYFDENHRLITDRIIQAGHKYDNSGVCVNCGFFETGLDFVLNDNGDSWSVAGIGTFNGSELKIPASNYDAKPVTAIRSRAFENCINIESVRIPKSIETIGLTAFSYCNNLKEVSFAHNSQLTSLGDNAFAHCTRLGEFIIPESVIYIGIGAFLGCNRLNNVLIPEGVETIDEWAFSFCYNLTNITIPKSVVSINDSAFLYCYKLVEIYNRSSLNIIAGAYDNGRVGTYAKNVYSKENETKLSIDDNGFVLYCDGSEKILISYNGSNNNIFLPDDITEIYQGAFYGYNEIESVTIPSSVKMIGNHAFGNCSTLTTVNWNAINCTLTASYNYPILFDECIALSTINIGDEVISIPDYAFYECSALECIIFPNSVKHIGKGALLSCTRLESLSIPFVGEDFGGAENTHFGYIFGATTYDGHASCVPSTLSKVIITSATTIANYAFENCNNLLSITLPKSLISIGKGSFSRCYRLVEVINGSSLAISAGDTENGEIALHALDVISREDVSKIRKDADGFVVYDNGEIKSLVKYMGKEEDIVIPNNITDINQYAFYCCNNLTSVIIPDSVGTIGHYAFEKCTGLNSIVIPNSVMTIGYGAFYQCSNLKTITVPDEISTIGYYAFQETAWYNDIPNGLIYIGNVLYSYKGTMETDTSIVIKDGTVSITAWAFYNCKNLTSVVVPKTITHIGQYAFYECTGLTTMTLEDSSFWYCTKDYNDWQNKADGTLKLSIDASYFTDYYNDYYWYKL